MSTVAGQTCTIVVADTILCEGGTTPFTVNTTGGTPTAYSWAFGDGFTASTSSPSHTYTTAGIYFPTVTVTFSGGATCSITGQRIRVFANPSVKYVITSDDSLCFKGNNLCILDQSTPGTSNAPIKKRVFQLSNGFIQKDSIPYSPSICYQNTTEILGHLYTLVLEVTDTNNCVSRLQKPDSVRLFPKNPPINFQTNYSPTCGDILVNFFNTTTMPVANVKRFHWDFDNGKRDSTFWNAVAHLYAKPGPYFPKLYVWDQNNCADTGYSTHVVESIVPDTLIHSTTGMKQCFDKNEFRLASKNPAGSSFWGIYDASNNRIDTTVLPKDTLVLKFKTCGLYRVRLTVYFPDCMFTTDTLLTVLGPKAMIQDITQKSTTIEHMSQCQIFDTIYYKTPIPYLNCTYKNSSIYHLWDFGDAFAPPCTTDTKRGINVGMNCNFSQDSMQVKHRYTTGRENCYLTKLFLKDSLTGCTHNDSTSLALRGPNAHPDTFSIPKRRGIYTLGDQCLPTAITIKTEETLPRCFYERAWINPDSACDKNNWILADTLSTRTFTYNYSSTCDPNGYVTIGIIIKNGRDANGNDCYDTAWYHHIIQLTAINANTKYTVDPGCKPYTVRFTAEDSIQQQLKKVGWDYGSRSGYFETFVGYSLEHESLRNDTVGQLFSVTDSIINGQVFTFLKNGVYTVMTTFTTQQGCARSNAQTVAVGYFAGFQAKRVSCLGDSITFLEKVQYYSNKFFDLLDPVEYWKQPARAAAGKEKIWWNMGDGKGFVYTGSNPKVKYDKPGTYTITMVTQDSAGCLDTVVKPNFIKVVELKPSIGLLQNSYFCAPQIVQFKDSSRVIDSVGALVNSASDTVITRLWDFGDGTANSMFIHPAHNFVSNGSYTITLTATTNAGCSDTAQVVIDLKGPRPMFDIVDSMGCEPFQVTFINTTGKPLKNWTWYYGDPAQQTFTTASDSAISFTYTKAGVYDVKILGTDEIFNPSTGNTVICNAFFPDPATGLPQRRVYVLPTPPLDLVSKDSVCPHDPLTLTAIGDTVYKDLTWIYGDGDTLRTLRPDTVVEHTYSQSGVYTIMLIPINSTGYECVDTVRKNIVVADVHADFTIDSSDAPEYTFNNGSTSAVRYVWSFGKPAAGPGNQSTQTHGMFNYNDTGLYHICLMAFNADDCWDSVCKSIHIVDARVTIPNVFTPDNNDNTNDAFDIDIIGFTKYDLQVFNRWGREVYKSNKDGIRNDGVNWNGKDQNDGEPCAAGTYYYLFTYKLITEQTEKTVHGTITLIR
ncbi:MAG: PKD domain-containing protein [Bacteroidota bacterium]